jgi:sulfate adenylyltransferase subunit 1 (EFTu-like GTPase family)
MQVCDQLSAERQKGMTLDLHVRSFNTTKTAWTVLDLPGDRRRLKSALTGAHACMHAWRRGAHGVVAEAPAIQPLSVPRPL